MLIFLSYLALLSYILNAILPKAESCRKYDKWFAIPVLLPPPQQFKHQARNISPRKALDSFTVHYKVGGFGSMTIFVCFYLLHNVSTADTVSFICCH